jgi:hypothetical protein
MMSDMKTFTVRELDRSPATVLDAAEADGAVLVKRRDGRTYRVAPVSESGKPSKSPDFAAWRREVGMPRIPLKQAKAVDRLIAGE